MRWSVAGKSAAKPSNDSPTLACRYHLSIPRPTRNLQVTLTNQTKFFISQEIQNRIILEYKENNNNSSFKDKKQR